MYLIIKKIGLWLLGLFFFLAGFNHFLNTEFYVAIMPPYLPMPLELVYLSGIFEMGGGILVLLAPVRQQVGVFLLFLTLAVFPANIHMALHSQDFSEIASPTFLYVRLPLQIVILAWIYWVSLSVRSF